ncbi:MAG: pseudouridine-5'-phosphate glycosidase [Acidimicrobiales bacterium]|nr:pseudouridine-5'-phosphate glycosidase [Acidimicrobiales bacterium]
MSSLLHIHDEVADALRDQQPVVALESTIFSHLGLPSPSNAEALDRCLAAVRQGGAVPSITAVLDGVARVGIEPDEHDRILGPARKVAARDLPVAVAQRWEVGASTVSAALALAARAGIAVFTTGGIGGVHRDAHITGDVSADLDALKSFPVVTVCAGAKAFLDLARTLEHLESLGVPVVGWRSDQFPAFTTRTSGLPVPHRADTPGEIAAMVDATRSIGATHGLLVTVPVPEADAIAPEVLELATAEALADAAEAGVVGAAVTPFVLGRIASATDGASVAANLALAEHNAAVAAEIAGAIAAGERNRR